MQRMTPGSVTPFSKTAFEIVTLEMGTRGWVGHVGTMGYRKEQPVPTVPGCCCCCGPIHIGYQRELRKGRERERRQEVARNGRGVHGVKKTSFHGRIDF